MTHQDTIGSAPLFKNLTPRELSAIAELSRSRTYDAGETVFSEGSYGDEVCILVNGMIRIELTIRGETECATVQRFTAGQVFGEISLADRRNRSATAECETSCEIVAIPCKDLLDLFEKNHGIGYAVMKNLATVLATRLRKTNSQLISTFLWE